MVKRNPGTRVEDRWHKRDGSRSANYGKGKRWRARYVDDQGHEHAKAFDRKADAHRWLDNEITAKLATGTYVAPKAGLLTVGEMYASWSTSQAHITPKTAVSRRSTWRVHVQPRWAEVSVVDVKTSAVRAWVARMITDEVGVPTIGEAFALLRQVLGAAVEDRRIPRNPCEGVQLPKAKQRDRGYLSHTQVAALAAAVGSQPEVIRFLAYTGLRWGEMAALRVQDFDMLRRRVNVFRSVTEASSLVWGTPKTGERRSVPFPASIADELSALMVGKGREDLVFTSARGGVLRGSNYRWRVFNSAVDKCQKADDTFPHITPHDLRHTAASLAVSAGANVKAVQRMLGHAKASMTLDVYADLFDDDLDVVADKLDSALKSAADSLRTGSQSRN